MTVFEELKARGLIAQSNDMEGAAELVNSGKAVFYIGFDPTADSLHIGHMMQLIVMRHLVRAGNKAFILCGGGTAMIGDPSGRSDMRPMMTRETIDHNVECFKVQMRNIIDFDKYNVTVVNNSDWLLKLNYLEFLRDFGTMFSVNRMLTFDAMKTRMERGLTFLEFNYMPMQAYDFYHLHETYGVNMECGGDDQWANILAGAELIRRKDGEQAYALTSTLLLKADGTKMGKTSGGAVWIDATKTSPYDFYQYWRNVDDADVINTIKMCTEVPLEEIAEYEHLEGAALNPVKERLAFEVTKLVHGEEEAVKARDAAKNVFSAGAAADMPSTELADGDFADGVITIADLLVKVGIAASKGEARRLVDQGGVSVDDEKVASAVATLDKSRFEGEGVIIRKGKKVFHRAKLA